MFKRNVQSSWIGLVMVGLAVTIGCGKSSEETTVSTDESASESEAEATPANESAEPEITDTLAEEHPDFYVVATYDKSADPSEDLSRTLTRAKAEEKRVILQVGGDWCSWCALIADYMSTNETIRDHLNEHFLVMKVTYPSDYSEAFLADYPECEEYPHFFVLDSNGDLLHSQRTGELEKGEGYDDDAFMAFLQQWTP